MVRYTPEQAEAGLFEHRTHLFYVDWTDYKNHTMAGYAGIVLKLEESNKATAIAINYLGLDIMVGTAVDKWEKIIWRSKVNTTKISTSST